MAAIIRYSFKEFVRKKIFLITIVMSVAFLFLYSWGLKEIAENLKQQRGMMTFAMQQVTVFSSLGFYFSHLMVAFLVVFATSGIISSEIENYNVHTIIVRPIPRWKYVLARYLGALIFIALYSTAIFFSIYTINKTLGFSIEHPISQVVLGWLLFELIAIVLLTVTTFFSTSFSTLATGILVVLLFGFAMIGGFLEQIGYAIANLSKASTTLQTIGIVSSLILPTDNIYREMANILFKSNLIDFSTIDPFAGISKNSVYMKIYWFAYVFILLQLTVKKFEKKDLT